MLSGLSELCRLLPCPPAISPPPSVMFNLTMPQSHRFGNDCGLVHTPQNSHLRQFARRARKKSDGRFTCLTKALECSGIVSRTSVSLPKQGDDRQRCPSWVKDGPILSQARSRSKGPLSDQVADATKPRGQCRSWVDPCRWVTALRTAGIGASRPFQCAPAKVR